MEDVFISIIIPIYNTELYLEKCLNSVINQTYKNIEIILVNDGSTDKSSEICAEFASKDKRIKYYEIVNSGVSNARNIGIKNSSAEWITFVDSDDWISYDYCEKLANYIAIDRDLIIARTFSESNGIILDDGFKNSDFSIFETKTQKEVLYAAIINDTPIVREYPHLATCSAKLFRKKILETNNIWYDISLKYYEDAIFNMEVMAAGNQICIVNDILYFYRLHEDSSTQNFKSDTILYYIQAYEKLLEFKNRYNVKLDNNVLYFNIKNLNTIFTNYFKKECNFFEKYMLVKRVCRISIFKYAIQTVKIKQVYFRRRKLLVLFSRLHLYSLIVLMYSKK